MELERFDPADESQRAWVLGCDVVIDALFGVGLSRPIGAGTPFAAAVDWMNESRAAVVAADIASGVSADTGAVLGRAVRADRTVTFTLPKIGQAVGVGAALSGYVEVRDIGIPADLVRGLVCRAQTVERDFARAALPPRRADGHKGTFGKVLIVGGAVGYTGAPYLTAAAAVRTGCGLVSLGVPETIAGVKAVLSDGEVELVYEDQCLNAGNLSSQEVSPMACLPQLMSALRNGWLLEESEEDWQETSCFRLTVDQTGEQNGKILSTLWLRQEDGAPLRGEIAVDGEIILTADFTSFSFYDTIENQE